MWQPDHHNQKAKKMNVSIIGTGNMATGLAVLFAKAGHSVTLGSRDVAKAEAVAAELGHNVEAGDLQSAAGNASVVVLAVPFDAVSEVISAAGDLTGKIVVDITNPMTADYSGLAIGHSTSAAEEIQKLAPQANIVKAFNTIFAAIFQSGGSVAGHPATVFVAGDDEDARKTVASLAKDAGFIPLDTGGLASARYLEPVGALNIALGYARGLGTDIAPTWQGAV